MYGPEYDQIKLHFGANDLRCRKALLNRYRHLEKITNSINCHGGGGQRPYIPAYTTDAARVLPKTVLTKKIITLQTTSVPVTNFI